MDEPSYLFAHMQSKLPWFAEKLLELWAPRFRGIPKKMNNQYYLTGKKIISITMSHNYIIFSFSLLIFASFMYSPHHLRHPHSALHQKQIHAFPNILLGQPAEV